MPESTLGICEKTDLDELINSNYDRLILFYNGMAISKVFNREERGELVRLGVIIRCKRYNYILSYYARTRIDQEYGELIRYCENKTRQNLLDFHRDTFIDHILNDKTLESMLNLGLRNKMVQLNILRRAYRGSAHELTEYAIEKLGLVMA